MPVFDRIRLNLKFRHRSFQRYRSHQKIFLELGDTAPQSWTHFGKIMKIQDPSTDFQWKFNENHQESVQIMKNLEKNDVLQKVFTRDIGAQSFARLHIRQASSYIHFPLSKFLFFLKFSFFLTFSDGFWIFVAWKKWNFSAKPWVSTKMYEVANTKSSRKAIKNQNFKKTKILTGENVYKVMPTKYEVARTIELRYLA